jgi:hypothetical protein
MFKKYTRYLFRAWQLGIATSTMLLFYRIKKIIFIHRWRGKKKSFVPLEITSSKSLTINILGFGSHHFKTIESIAWHQDFFVRRSPASWQDAFFPTIALPDNPPQTINQERIADIKVPWELSRLHCLHNASAGDVLAILSSWMNQNPFPYGVNWLNPMEVAIRAINIITAIKRHANSPLFTPTVNVQLDDLLTHHALFIEHCWEVSATPNNHYLADLVGFLYLCSFLKATKYYQQRHQAWRWFVRALKKQLLADGTSYEGSTAYHGLVSQLLDLAVACAKEANMPISRSVYKMQEKMHRFIAACGDNQTMVHIGDDDSGVIYPEMVKKTELQAVEPHAYFSAFGLSLVRKADYFFTFRHPRWQPKQPTGHFHADELAITLNIQGVPIFIDPGSYLYTAHPAWRNRLRSAMSHTAVVPKTSEPVCNSIDLFQLPKNISLFKTTSSSNKIEDSYAWQDTRITRQCLLSNNEIIINDTIESNTTQEICWFWHLGPSITTKHEGNQLLLYNKENIVAAMHMPLAINQQETSCHSDFYGQCRKTTILQFLAEAQQGNKMMQQFRIFVMSVGRGFK